MRPKLSHGETRTRKRLEVLHSSLYRLLFVDLCVLALLPPLHRSVEVLEIPLIVALTVGAAALLHPLIAKGLLKTEEWQSHQKNRRWAKGILIVLLGLSALDGLVHIAKAGTPFLIFALLLIAITLFRTWSAAKNRWREIERVLADRVLRRRRSEEAVALFIAAGILASRAASVIAVIVAAGTSEDIFIRILAYLPYGAASLLLLTLLNPEVPLVEECKRCEVVGPPRPHSWCPSCGKTGPTRKAQPIKQKSSASSQRVWLRELGGRLAKGVRPVKTTPSRGVGSVQR